MAIRQGKSGPLGRLRIFTPPGVFQARSDTWMLVDAVRNATLQPRAEALDLAGRVDYLIGEGRLRGPRLEEEVLVIRARRSGVLVEAAAGLAAVMA